MADNIATFDILSASSNILYLVCGVSIFLPVLLFGQLYVIARNPKNYTKYILPLLMSIIIFILYFYILNFEMRVILGGSSLMICFTIFIFSFRK